VLWHCWLGGRKGIRPVKKWRDGGGRHWLDRREWRPAGWSVCLPLLIFPCTIKSRGSLLARAHPGGPRKRAVKRLCVCVLFQRRTSGDKWHSFFMGKTPFLSTKPVAWNYPLFINNRTPEERGCWTLYAASPTLRDWNDKRILSRIINNNHVLHKTNHGDMLHETSKFIKPPAARLCFYLGLLVCLFAGLLKISVDKFRQKFSKGRLWDKKRWRWFWEMDPTMGENFKLVCIMQTIKSLSKTRSLQ